MLDNYKEKLKEKGEIYLRIKVRPLASLTAVKQISEDEDGDTIKIDLAAAPVKGKANLELIKFLADEFAVNKDNVKIISGAGERVKLIKISV